jgi:leucyl-tRNA synthetase
MSYGTGAIMAVPGQDQRDWDFAKEFDLPIIRTVEPEYGFDGEAYLGEGPAISSEFLNGLNIADAKEKIISWLDQENKGQGTIQYKLRDWLFSRQRYWGEPIPIIHYDDDSKPLDESELPLELPAVEKYEPTGTGESPLANIKEWVEIKNEEGEVVGLRETNTMPQWAGSCWYYLRYIDPQNSAKGWAADKESYWMPVDLYVGGAEHAVLHLLYARFWHHVLHDLGHVSTREPFQKLFNQGMILGEDGLKMSKSRGNVINPDEVVDKYGADSMRLYEMFMGPLDKAKPWQTKGLQGCSRFINKLWHKAYSSEGLSSCINLDTANTETIKLLHQTIKKVGADIENLRFNTAISQMMIFTNHLVTLNVINKDVLTIFTQLLAPFIPHTAEELWQLLGNENSITFEPWPEYDEELVKENIISIAIQVNGKLRTNIEIDANTEEGDVLQLAKENDRIDNYIGGKELIKEIYVPGRLINFVVK